MTVNTPPQPVKTQYLQYISIDIVPATSVLATFAQIRNISAVTDLILTKLYGWVPEIVNKR